MSKNDEQIQKLLGVITTKRDALGKRPQMRLKTNALFKTYEGKTINLNTVNSLDGCINAVATIIGARDAYVEAAKLLEVDYESPNYNGFPVKDWIDDFKLKASIITWATGDKKIKTLESTLKNLRSEDLKTADALADIAGDLGI